MLGVNPNTVLRALRELRDEGLLEFRRGRGITVAGTAEQSAVIDQVRAMPAGHGLNALSGEFVDLFEDGVIDPLRVTRLTIQHAASVAALMLTTEALVAEEMIAQPGAIIAPGFGDLAEGLARPSSPV